MEALRGSAPKFLFPPNFVLNIHHNKNKNIVPLTDYFTL